MCHCVLKIKYESTRVTAGIVQGEDTCQCVGIVWITMSLS